MVSRLVVLFVGFDPTATKGVFVYHDAAGGGRSPYRPARR